MDNTQISAPDGAWFLFADWQGVTRIGFPGDKVKTDADLDRPYEDKPLVVRPNGMVWSAYHRDIDPVALKKVAPVDPGHDSPDPLGGPELVVGYSGETVTVRGRALQLAASGEALQLGGVPGRLARYGATMYNVWPDGALVVFGQVANQTQVALVLRDAEGAGRVAWGHPTALLPNGSPDAFRERGSTWLVDRDPVEDVAYLIAVDDDGAVLPVQRTTAVAGPWVFAGQVWWQPDDATLCAGPSLGVVARSIALPPAHAGPGRLLRVPGRTLFLPWHGTAILDLAPAKKGKDELSRKHKAADAPLYHEAERTLRPIREGMARRGVRVEWRGCTRRGPRRTPMVRITGRSDLVTYILGYALQNGLAARLAGFGVTSIDFSGGGAFDDILAPRAPTTAQELGELVAMFDAAGISRAAGFGQLHSLAQTAAQRGLALPYTPEAEEFALAAVLSGLRRETSGPVPPATAGDVVAIAPILGDYQRLHADGIVGPYVAMFLAVVGHRRFGASAVAPIMTMLAVMNPSFPAEVAQALGQPVAAPVGSPPVEEPALDAEQARIVAALEGVLVQDFAVDLEASREGQGWYRFSIGDTPFQGGLHDDVRVQATLCATDTDLDLRKLAASLATANKAIVGAQFMEADCYIHVRAACSFAEASAARLKAMIQACSDAVESAAGQSLRAKYRTYD